MSHIEIVQKEIRIARSELKNIRFVSILLLLLFKNFKNCNNKIFLLRKRSFKTKFLRNVSFFSVCLFRDILL